MVIQYRKWCPNGCGKKVVISQLPRYHRGEGAVYTCQGCGKDFTKEDLKFMNNMKKTIKEKREEKEKNEKE